MIPVFSRDSLNTVLVVKLKNASHGERPAVKTELTTTTQIPLSGTEARSAHQGCERAFWSHINEKIGMQDQVRQMDPYLACFMLFLQLKT